MTSPSYTIENTPLTNLTPAPYNPRTITKKKLDLLKKSIQEDPDFLHARPLIANRRPDGTLIIIGGNQRHRAAQELGWTTLPTLIIQVSIEREKALNLKDNAPFGEFDATSLTSVLEQLKDLPNLPASTGLDIAFINKHLRSLHADGEDDIPEVSEPVSQLGSRWTLGPHTIICGDSTTPTPYPQSADLLFTDPPYGVNYSSKNAFLNKYDKGNRIQKDIEGDTSSPKETHGMWTKAFTQAKEHMRDGASYYVCGPPGDLLIYLLEAMRDSGLPHHQGLCWDKGRIVPGRSDYKYQHETILYGWKPGAAHKFYGPPGESSVWSIPKPQASKLHPTMKPVELVTKAVLNSTQQGETVLDPFLGSGTTLIAAEQTSRICHGIEIDPHYVDVAVRRWENLTNKKAVHHP